MGVGVWLAVNKTEGIISCLTKKIKQFLFYLYTQCHRVGSAVTMYTDTKVEDHIKHQEYV